MRTSTRSDLTLTIVLGVVSALVLIPFAWVILGAFKTDTEIFGDPLQLPQSWTGSNFVTAWTSGGFADYSINSILVAVSATVLSVVVCVPAGYVFAKLAGRWTGWLFYVLLFTMAIPAEAIVIPTFYQMKSLGLVDSRVGLILVVVAAGLPLGVFLARNFFRDLPDSLAEAAALDGASTWRTFVGVMLPLAKPAVLAIAVFAFLAAWNEYVLALLLLFSPGTMTLPLGLTQFQSQYTSDYGALFAGITMAMVPSVLVYLVLQRSFTRGVLAGSLR